MENEIKPALLKPKEVAKLLSISPKSLWNYTQAGIIPAVHIGEKLVRYNPTVLQDLINQNAMAR